MVLIAQQAAKLVEGDILKMATGFNIDQLLQKYDSSKECERVTKWLDYKRNYSWFIDEFVRMKKAGKVAYLAQRENGDVALFNSGFVPVEITFKKGTSLYSGKSRRATRGKNAKV